MSTTIATQPDPARADAVMRDGFTTYGMHRCQCAGDRDGARCYRLVPAPQATCLACTPREVVVTVERWAADPATTLDARVAQDERTWSLNAYHGAGGRHG